MARFYDDLRREGILDPELRTALSGAMVIDASALSEYLYLNEAKGEWDLVEDFFNLAPPFESFFVECRAPQSILTEAGLRPWPSTLPRRWGVLFKAHDITTWSSEVKFRSFGDYLPDDARWMLQAVLLAETPYTANGRYNGKLREQFSWLIPIRPDGSQPLSEPRGRAFKFEYRSPKGEKTTLSAHHCENSATRLPEPVYKPDPNRPGHGLLQIEEERFSGFGRIKGIDSSCRVWPITADQPRIDESVNLAAWEQIKDEKVTTYIAAMSLREDIAEMGLSAAFWFIHLEERHWVTLLLPCLMSICFMHAKGVTLEEVKPPAKLVQRAKKERKESPCTYHVLEIQPFKRTLEREGSAGRGGAKKALHLCRGHFHTYRDEEGHRLFGRKGAVTVWVPMHTRGSVEAGLADKSYKVEKPKEGR